MGSPTIFSGKFTKLLTNKGILNSDGSLNQNDGPLNYIKYAQLEQGLTTGWSLGTTGTLTNAIPTGSPTFGSGASGNLSISAQSTGALRGSYSLQYASSAATTAGNMLASDALAIDVADRAKVLTYKFYYNVSANPTNGNFSGTSSNSFGVAVYDVTNSAWLGVVGNFSMTQSSGTGIASGTFQTNSTTASIRFVVYNANATTGAITLLMDDFFVGPQQTNIGPVVTDFQAFTGTSSWTTGTLYSWEKRIGDSADYRFYLSLSGTPSGNLTFNLPSGRSVDSTKILGVGSDTTVVGRFRIIRQGTNIWNGDVILTALTGTAFALRFSTSAGATSPVPNNSIVSNTSPASFVSGDFVEVEIYNVPISGWSSNVQMSSDSYQGVVDLQINNGVSITPSGTIGTSFATASAINFNKTPIKDSTGSYSAGIYTAPISGDYFVTSKLEISHTNSTGTFLSVSVAVNGVERCTQAIKPTTTNAYPFISTLVTGINAGDLISIRCFGDSTSKAFASSIVNDFTVNRLSGPSVLAATETVALSAYSSSGTTLTASTAVVVNWNNKDYDTNGILTGNNTITIPISGKYRITSQVVTASTAFVSGNVFYQNLYKNNVFYRTMGWTTTTGATSQFGTTGTISLNCNAGDTIQIKAFQNSALSPNTTTDGTTYINLERVGN